MMHPDDDDDDEDEFEDKINPPDKAVSTLLVQGLTVELCIEWVMS